MLRAQSSRTKKRNWKVKYESAHRHRCRAKFQIRSTRGGGKALAAAYAIHADISCRSICNSGFARAHARRRKCCPSCRGSCRTGIALRRSIRLDRNRQWTSGYGHFARGSDAKSGLGDGWFAWRWSRAAIPARKHGVACVTRRCVLGGNRAFRRRAPCRAGRRPSDAHIARDRRIFIFTGGRRIGGAAALAGRKRGASDLRTGDPSSVVGQPNLKRICLGGTSRNAFIAGQRCRGRSLQDS